MVAEHNTVGEAKVEGLHPHQLGNVGLCVEQQYIQQVREFLLGFIWRGIGVRDALLARM